MAQTYVRTDRPDMTRQADRQTCSLRSCRHRAVPCLCLRLYPFGRLVQLGPQASHFCFMLGLQPWAEARPGAEAEIQGLLGLGKGL